LGARWGTRITGRKEAARREAKINVHYWKPGVSEDSGLGVGVGTLDGTLDGTFDENGEPYGAS